ncbi:CatB-related O-acetyltransferase [Mucilaginibacter gilvus]|uniref:CatB-related O-acetyltransferase n=1 Tax=Mucilaginibacter gilvus TaxID=2305909 RepID=A0A444MIY8_9SPHI|nr:CatB-related O-acetyltransferase [Mucilaginibacter gilvus]RWY48095.1 CatB-related O-acetyltransferase [Mucilaginibacter gilvus]
MRKWLKRNYYRLINYNNSVKIGGGVEFNIHNFFEGHNVVGSDAIIGSTHIGYGTYISSASVIKNTSIGRFCSIGSNVQTGLGRHPSKDFVSTHPAFFSTQEQAGFTYVSETIFNEFLYADEEHKRIVTIGNDVWIGNNVIIMDGIKIGDGAIVAAGAIVTKDVQPYAIVAGIPAKFIRYRFGTDEIAGLLRIKWWDWTPEKIRANSHFFKNITQFIASADQQG